MTSASMAHRSSMAFPAAMISPSLSIHAQAQAGLEHFLRPTRSQVTRTLPWSKREHPAIHPFDSSRPPAAGCRPSELSWRASDPATTATHFLKHSAAPRTVSKVHAGLKYFLRPTGSQVTRTLPWSKCEHPATHAFDAWRPPAAGCGPSELSRRATDPATTAMHFSGDYAAPRTSPGIAMRRPVDLVWLASPASAAPPNEPPGVGTALVVGAPSARSIQAVAAAPMGPGFSSDNTVVGATALDPVLANRLADEVMRRIDHRARIERERRGL